MERDVFVWPWSLGDRLRKAMELGGVTREQMAVELGVSPPTVSRYLNGTVAPKKRDLRVWALRTGVPYDALVGGPGFEPTEPTTLDEALGRDGSGSGCTVAVLSRSQRIVEDAASAA